MNDTNINTMLIERFIPLYTDWFYKQEDDSDERFSLISGYICRYVLYILYVRFVRDDNITKLEDLPLDKKEKYWRLAKMYYKGDNEYQKIRASTGAYVLELITSTF